jgi:RNA polymerase sigma-70 factor (ECF subfamily)
MAPPRHGPLPGDMTDEELVELAKVGGEKGDAAFTKIVRRYEERLLNYAFRMCWSRHEAFDYVQRAFVKFHERLPAYREEGKLFAYLTTIMWNLCPSAKPWEVFGIDQRAFDSVPSQGISVEDLLLINEDRLRALSALTPPQIQVLVMRAYGITWDEIAARLGIPVETAQSRRKAAAKELLSRAAALQQGLPFRARLTLVEVRECIAKLRELLSAPLTSVIS